MRRSLAIFVVAAFVAGCTAARTEVLLVIDTDLRVPDELDEIRVDLIGPNGETRRSEGSVEGPGDLPRTLGVVDQTHSSRTVRVTVTGLQDGANVIQRRAVFEFVPRETRILRVDLLRACLGVSCPAGETCGADGCRPIETAPRELLAYDPNRVTRADGGEEVDAGVDGGCVVMKEACNALDDDCDGAVDEDFDLARDRAHCGACGNACVESPENGAAACVDGGCALDCDPGFLDCNGIAGDGCEADLTRPATCGGCDITCGGATPFCTKSDVGMACVASCGSGSTDCEGTCADITSDPAHCGGCDNRCAAPANASATCMLGACSFECDEGYADCDGDPANGCEATLTELEHCGRCGARCELPGAVTSCVTGTCELLGCATLFGDCDGDPANGCEEDLSANLERCGACESACESGVDNGAVACVEGSCQLTCNPGFGDCDAVAATGCEQSLTGAGACGMCGVSCAPEELCEGVASGGYACTEGCMSGVRCGSSCATLESDPLHCGACDNACPGAANAVASCESGACALRCASGFGDCDEDMGNGCEAVTASDVANCGACGVACSDAPHAPASCESGRCVLRCEPGFADCNGVASDGCEAELDADPAHCGVCGNACATGGEVTGAACVDGACAIVACSAPNADCDGTFANGCEIDTDVNKHHCGACGERCTGPRRCCGGVCRPRGECP